MKKELLDVIKKSLPQQTGEALKELLQEGEQNKVELERLTKINKELNEGINSLTSKLKGIEIELAKYKDLEEREAKLLEATRQLDIQKLQHELSCEKEKTQFSKDIALGLVRNTEYRKSIFESYTDGQPVKDQYGGVYYPQPTNKSYDEDKTAK